MDLRHILPKPILDISSLVVLLVPQHYQRHPEVKMLNLRGGHHQDKGITKLSSE